MNTTSVSEVMEGTPRQSRPVAGSADIGTLLDDGPYTRMQKIVVLLAALSIVMDGFDGQLIGFAIPLMIKEWGSPARPSPRRWPPG